MPAIRISSNCTEFSRPFTLGQVVTDLGGGHARAMVASGLAAYHRFTGIELVGNSGGGTSHGPDVPLLAFCGSGELFPMPLSGVVPITSVQFSAPALFGMNVISDRTYDLNGVRYRWSGSAMVAA